MQSQLSRLISAQATASITFMALRTVVEKTPKCESAHTQGVEQDVLQIGSPFLISWPSFTRTSTTTPDIGAPTEPGSAVAFSRDTVSTAEFLSSTDTARTCHAASFSLVQERLSNSVTHFTIHLKPDVTLRTALDHRANSHQPYD